MVALLVAAMHLAFAPVRDLTRRHRERRPTKLLKLTAAEVGFTSYGPIFNLRLALASKRADAVIDGIELEVRHSDGAAQS